MKTSSYNGNIKTVKNGRGVDLHIQKVVLKNVNFETMDCVIDSKSILMLTKKKFRHVKTAKQVKISVGFFVHWTVFGFQV